MEINRKKERKRENLTSKKEKWTSEKERKKKNDHQRKDIKWGKKEWIHCSDNDGIMSKLWRKT